tara:strand:+ start:189 stop:449 length:261 start_codon:yes stop_codon:yes gene_type:complete
MAKMNKKTLTKHDLLRAIKGIAMELQILQRHVMMIDNILDKYIHMNKDEEKFKKYMEKIIKEEEKKKDEHKQGKRKQSGRSAKASK